MSSEPTRIAANPGAAGAMDERPVEAAAGSDYAGNPAEIRVPLAVDIDGTLVASDLTLESIFVVAKAHPFDCLMLPFWLSRGRAHFKARLAGKARPDASTLPYNRELVDFLREQKRVGRTLILMTAADQAVADDIARELGLFDAVYGSNGTTNLTRERKLERLRSDFGIGRFDYIGDNPRDRAVAALGHKAILAGPSSESHVTAGRVRNVDGVLETGKSEIVALGQTLRVEHWLKNVLVFLPLVAAHQLYNFAALPRAIAVFVAFCLCASSIYLLNDLLDLPRDRVHPHKRHRALASGRLPIRWAVALIPLLWTAAIAMALTLPGPTAGILALYSVLMLGYCLRLRDIVIVDVITLAMGYALRVVGGATASGLAIQFWLLTSCVLFFFGLALLKRYAELVTLRSLEGPRARAHSYFVGHSGLVAALGCTSGYLSVAVYAYHTDFDYRQDIRYTFIWLVFPLLLYWLSHIWLLARRGRIAIDPVAFALSDRTSQILGALAATAILIST